MTMQNFPLTQSPRGQSMQVQDSGAQLQELFNDGFHQLAYNQFQKAFPDLMGNVVTFKILQTDPDEGTGIGVFVLYQNGQTFYTPAVVSNNEIKPLDVFYSKDNDRYYPLTPEWLNEASKNTIPELGHAVQTPKTLQTDVDIRNLVVPPTTGRYSYASDGSGGWMLPELLKKSPAAVKTAVLSLFSKHANLFETAVRYYGKSVLRDALIERSEKTASVEEVKMKHDKFRASTTGNVIVADKNTSASKLREMFGEGAGEAYSTIRSKGFYAKDYRKQTGRVLQMDDSVIRLEEPTSSGLYRVYLTDGTSHEVFVLTDVVHVCSTWDDAHKYELRNRTGRSYARQRNAQDFEPNSPRAAARNFSYLVVFKDGRYAMLRRLMGEQIQATHDEVAKWIGDGGEPKVGARGFFLSTRGTSFRGTDVGWADRVSSANKRTTVRMAGCTVVVDDTMRGKTVLYPAEQQAVYLPGSYKFHTVKERLEPEAFYTDGRHISRVAEEKMKTAGAKKVEVRKAEDGFYVGRGGPALSKSAALRETALMYDVSINDALELLKRAEDGGVTGHWAFSAEDLAKVAAAGSPQGQSPGAAPSGQGGPGAPMDPGMMDPSMMAPPGPPQPTSIELAAAEMMQQLQQQQQAMSEKMQLLQQVAARAQQIEMSGAGVMAAPMATALIAPPTPAGGAGAPAPGAAPQGAPGAPGDPAMGGDPNMAQGMDPGMQGSVPMARMTEDRLTPQNVEQSVNPQFLSAAADLDDQNVFDAAAVASLAQNPNVVELAQAYTPVLDKALDNLGRLLLLFNMKENMIVERIGHDGYAQTQQKLRDVFRGLGDTLLKVEQMSQQRTPEYSDEV